MNKRSDERGFVYFALAGEFMKIGFTADWRDRLRTLRTSAPQHISMFVVMHGDRSREGALHQQFAHLRAEGEWFAFADDLASFIKALPPKERVR